MKKKYEFPKENTNDEVKEPAITYRTNMSDHSILPSYSLKELRDRADRAIEEVETGKVVSQEEMRRRHPR